MQRVGIIDLGSNSVRLVIVHIYKNKSHNLMYTQKSSLRLGQRINKNGELMADAVTDIIDAIEKFHHMCKLFNTSKILGVATAAIREAKNGDKIVSRIKEKTGLDINIISGESEANYGYLGVINTIAENNAILFDLGGGSLELVLIRDRQAENLLSLNIGTITMTEKFQTADQMSSRAFRELTSHTEQALKKALPWLNNSKLPIIGIGGTVRNIAKIYQRRINYGYSKLHNYRLTNEQFAEVFNMLRNTNCEQRKKIPGLSGERADIIMAGVTVINTLLNVTKSKDFIISGCGVREGLFYDYYLEKLLERPAVMDNILKESVENLLSFSMDRVMHSRRVADMSEKMFTAWQPLHNLGADEARILYVAATLHDLGISINYYSHAKHSAYLIKNAPLMGITHKEQIMAALVANWHNGISAKTQQESLYKELLNEKDLTVARKLSVILAMAESLDFTETGAARNIFPGLLPDGRAVLGIAIDEVNHIEIDELYANLDLFKKELKTELVVTRATQTT